MAELIGILKYPVKGLAGLRLDSTQLTENKGIVGDRQFALTTDAEVDGNRWKSSRSFLINAVNDNLLKVKPDWSFLKLGEQDLPGLAPKLVATKIAPPAG